LPFTLAAPDLAGRHPGDRIEHGAVIALAHHIDNYHYNLSRPL